MALNRFSSFITKALLKQALPLIGVRASTMGEAAALVLKNRLLEAVENHPVCIELRDKTSPSRFIPSKSGTATLAGYLGMPESDDPVGNLIDYLDKTIVIKSKRAIILGNKIITTLSIPSKKDMNSESSLAHPRLGLAWPVILEEGLTGLANASFFLQAPPAKTGGDSGLGIQISNKTRPRIGRIQFLSTLFKEFREKFGKNE